MATKVHTVKERYMDLLSDSINAFIVFYATFLYTISNSIISAYERGLAIPIIVAVLLYDLSFGLDIRYSLFSSGSNTLRKLSEMWSFVMAIVLYVSVKFIVRIVTDWVVFHSPADSLERAVFIVVYIVYVVFVCVFLQHTHLFITKKNYRSDTMFVNRLSIGISMIITDDIFKVGSSSGSALQVVFMSLVFFFFLSLDILINSMYSSSDLAKDKEMHDKKLFVIKQGIFATRCISLSVRIGAFVLTRTVLSLVTNHLTIMMSVPSRIAIPVMITVIFNTGITVSATSQNAFVVKNRGLVQDIMFGILIFVSQFILDDINSTTDNVTQIMIGSVAAFSLLVFFNFEVAVEKAALTEWNTSHPMVFKVFAGWVDVFNRLVIYVLIQLLVDSKYAVYFKRYTPTALTLSIADMEISADVFYPLFIAFVIFSIFPSLGESQSEHLNAQTVVNK
jgi:hypothetical protein